MRFLQGNILGGDWAGTSDAMVDDVKCVAKMSRSVRVRSEVCAVQRALRTTAASEIREPLECSQVLGNPRATTIDLPVRLVGFEISILVFLVCKL